MKNSNMVTCSFTMDRATYNEFKSEVARMGETVKGNLINHMLDVIHYETPNEETIAAIKEVEEMKKNPHLYKSYNDVDEMFKDILGHEV